MCIRDSYLATDPFVIRELLHNIGELQPLWKYVSPVFCLAMLVLAGMGAFRAIHRSVKGDPAFDPGRWAILISAACIMAVFSVMQGRWMATYGMVLLVLLAAPALNQASEILQRFFEKRQLFLLRRVMAVGVMLPVLLFGVAESLNPVVFPVPDPVKATRLSACQKDLIRFIRDDGFARAGALNRPLILMLPTNYAGVVWFWTPHTVIAGNYHRDVSGIRDVITFFRADAVTAQEILVRRRVDLVAYCTGEEGQGFFRDQGPLPGWLERIETEEAFDPDLHLYRVNPGRVAASGAAPAGNAAGNAADGAAPAQAHGSGPDASAAASQ